MKMGWGVPKRPHIKFRHRGITQKKAYNIQKTVKVWNQEYMKYVNRWQDYMKRLLKQDNINSAKTPEQNLSVGLTYYT
jgi:hypothetical protein